MRLSEAVSTLHHIVHRAAASAWGPGGTGRLWIGAARCGSELCLTTAMYKHRVKWMFRQTIRSEGDFPTEHTRRLLLSLLPPISKSFTAQLVTPLSLYICRNIFLHCVNHNVTMQPKSTGLISWFAANNSPIKVALRSSVFYLAPVCSDTFSAHFTFG